MIISDLIHELKTLKSKHGDIDVKVWGYDKQAYPKHLSDLYFVPEVEHHMSKYPACIVIDDGENKESEQIIFPTFESGVIPLHKRPTQNQWNKIMAKIIEECDKETWDYIGNLIKDYDENRNLS